LTVCIVHVINLWAAIWQGGGRPKVRSRRKVGVDKQYMKHGRGGVILSTKYIVKTRYGQPLLAPLALSQATHKVLPHCFGEPGMCDNGSTHLRCQSWLGLGALHNSMHNRHLWTFTTCIKPRRPHRVSHEWS
jgi:hypothetical protein